MAYTDIDLAAFNQIAQLILQLRQIVVSLQDRGIPAGFGHTAFLTAIDALTATIKTHARANI